MISDDDRREVARRLRELDYAGLQESLICAYLDALGIEGYADWVGIAHRLADLIEPEPERTCRVESSHEEEGDGCYSYFEYELTCGHEIAWGDQLPPSFCPECGRRVLYDSDDYI